MINKVNIGPFFPQIATDPVLAWQKAKELFAELSQPEPENQARPATLEELVVLLTRETARKMVHLIHYTHTDLPKYGNYILDVFRQNITYVMVLINL